MALLVADSGPLIALAKLELLWLPSRIEHEVLITDVFWSEVTRSPPPSELALLESARTSGWLRVVSGVDPPQAWLTDAGLDAGELSALALALNLQAWVLVDEQRGRSAAARCGLEVIGTLGLLLLARERRLIGVLRPLVDALLAGGYFLSRPLIDGVLARAGE